MSVEVITTPEPTRFHETPRGHLHTPYRGHPLAHIIRALYATLDDLVAGLALRPNATVLDYSCADMAYRELFDRYAPIGYIGADLPGNPDADVEIRPDGTLPIADGTVDAVFSSQV